MEWTPAQIRLFRTVGLYLPQSKFAKELGFAKRTIGNAERGTHPPSLALGRALDQALERASEVQRNRFLAAVAALQDKEAAVDSPARDAQHTASQALTKTEQFTAHLNGAAQCYETLVASPGNSAFDWLHASSLPSTATHAVGKTDVRIIRAVTEMFRNLDNRFGGGHTRAATSYLVSDVLPMLQEGRYREDIRRTLFTTVAELHQVVGWTWYDVGDNDTGRYYLSQAMLLCREVSDDALAGEMLAGMSHQAAFLHQPAVAMDLAQAARDHGKRANVPALVAEASVMEAQALALAKDAPGCLAALHESERAFAAAQERDRPDWIGYFDAAYLAAKFGRCFRDIGRHVEAEQFARRSLDMVDGYDRGRLFNLVLLASVLTAQREVDEACQTATAALRIACDVRSVRTIAELTDLSHRLAPFRAYPAVRMLTEEMRLTGVLVHHA